LYFFLTSESYWTSYAYHILHFQEPTNSVLSPLTCYEQRAQQTAQQKAAPVHVDTVKFDYHFHINLALLPFVQVTLFKSFYHTFHLVFVLLLFGCYSALPSSTSTKQHH
jgi:hypothetical protein